MPRENKRKKPSLTVQISLIIGIVAGIAMQSIPDIAEGYVKPFGTIYLNLIKMIVVPVVVLSIIQGIVSLQDVRKVGSIGIKTIAFYLVTTAIAVTLGLVAAMAASFTACGSTAAESAADSTASGEAAAEAADAE